MANIPLKRCSSHISALRRAVASIVAGANFVAVFALDEVLRLRPRMTFASLVNCSDVARDLC